MEASVSSGILKHIPALRVYSRALCKTTPEADALLERSLLQAIDEAERGRAGGDMRTWLLTLMRRRFLEDVGMEAQAHSAPTRFNGDNAGLHAALGHMARDDREAVILVDALGRTSGDAAQVMGTSVENVESRLQRARVKLREGMANGDPGRN